jgi:predicted nucleic acid-binding protein
VGQKTEGTELTRVKVWLPDAGPLVPYLNVRDSAHNKVAECLDRFTGQLVTTSAVITEAMYFVTESPDGAEALAGFAVAAHLLVYECSHPFQLRDAVRIMKKYEDTPMGFAHATLVLLADQLPKVDILTLYRRGFSAYRTRNRNVFRLVLGT